MKSIGLHKELNLLMVEVVVYLCILKFVYKCITGNIQAYSDYYPKIKKWIYTWEIFKKIKVNKINIPRNKTCNCGFKKLQELSSLV